MVNYLKYQNNNDDLFYMKEEYYFSTSYFVNPTTFYKECIERITTKLMEYISVIATCLEQSKRDEVIDSTIIYDMNSTNDDDDYMKIIRSRHLS